MSPAETLFGTVTVADLAAEGVRILREAKARFHGTAGFIAAVILSAPLGIVNTFGEELGWSGLLTPRLLDLTTFTRASLIRGAIWSV